MLAWKVGYADSRRHKCHWVRCPNSCGPVQIGLFYDCPVHVPWTHIEAVCRVQRDQTAFCGEIRGPCPLQTSRVALCQTTHRLHRIAEVDLERKFICKACN